MNEIACKKLFVANNLYPRIRVLKMLAYCLKSDRTSRTGQNKCFVECIEFDFSINASQIYPHRCLILVHFFFFSVLYTHEGHSFFLNRMLIRSNQECNLQKLKTSKQKDWIFRSVSLHFSVKGL